MTPDLNPYDLPAVLLLDDMARALRTSVRTLYRKVKQGTFPIRPMTSPASPIGIDKKYRWARRDVEQFLDGGFHSFEKSAVRLRRSA